MGVLKIFMVNKANDTHTISNTIKQILENNVTTTAIEEGITLDKSKDKLTSLKPKLVGKNSKRYEVALINAHPPITKLKYLHGKSVNELIVRNMIVPLRTHNTK